MSAASQTSMEKLEREHHQFVDEHEVGQVKGLETAEILSRVDEKKLIRKIDFKLVPFLSLLYLLSFLDRVNIGQAKLNNLERDLKLTGNQYSIALITFFVGYVVTEIPSNILLKKLRPTRFIPGIMIAWGVVMLSMGFVHNFGGLVATRFILGLSESGLFPGICFYLTMWYKRRETTLRLAIFFSSATLSGAFGGLLAYGLAKMDGLGGRPGWAWIFIIEGLLTVLVGLIAPFMMADFPEESTFLTQDEKAAVIARLKEDQGAAGEAEFDRQHFWNALKDWRVWTYMLIYIGVAEPLYSLSLFVPTIIASLGTWTRPQSMLLSTPPYFLAFFITIGSALYSDRVAHRGFFNVFWMGMVVVGYAILLAVNPRQHPGVAYFALFLCVAGVSPCISGTISWCGNNIGPTLKRATGMGMMFTLGNSGGIISSLVYFKEDAPRYRRGHAIGLGFAAMSMLLSLFLTLNLSAENRRRDEKYGSAVLSHDDIVSGKMTKEQLQHWGLDGMSEKEIIALGDRHPAFRYIP